MLSHQKLKSLLEYNPDTGLFRWLQKRGGPQTLDWRKGCPDGKGYYTIHIEKNLYRVHRLAWFYVYGVWPSKQIDHIDGDKENTKLNNLRLATGSENMYYYHQLKKLKNNEQETTLASC